MYCGTVLGGILFVYLILIFCVLRLGIGQAVFVLSFCSLVWKVYFGTVLGGIVFVYLILSIVAWYLASCFCPVFLESVLWHSIMSQ